MVFIWNIPSIHQMSASDIQKQVSFLAFFASCTLLLAWNFASIMSSAETGSADTDVYKSVRFVCTSCERRNIPAFYATLRACRIQMGHSKRCNGAPWKKVTVMTWPGDVIAGGSGGMGPCPAPQHQPSGINHI